MEDTSSLKLALSVGSVFGKFPYGFLSSHRKFWNAYVFFWFSLSWLLGISCSIYELVRGLDFFFYMLPIMLNGEWLVLNAICAKKAMKHSKEWKNILAAFDRYDRISCNVTTSKRRHVYLFSTVIFLINSSIAAGNIHSKFFLDLRLLRFMNWIYNINMCVILFAVIHQTLSLLEERYSQVKSDISAWRPSRTLKNKVNHLMVRYEVLNEVSDNINEMFGGVMLMLTLNSFLTINDLIAIFIMQDQKTTTWLIFMKLFVQCIVLEIVSILVIYKYDKIEECGKDIVKICSTYEAFNDSTSMSLTNFFEKLSPTFTADGYFVLNKQLLPSMLAEITTYVIVMLQLKQN